MSPRPDVSGRGMSFCSHSPQSAGRQEERATRNQCLVTHHCEFEQYSGFN